MQRSLNLLDIASLYGNKDAIATVLLKREEFLKLEIINNACDLCKDFNHDNYQYLQSIYSQIHLEQQIIIQQPSSNPFTYPLARSLYDRLPNFQAR